MKPYKNIDIDYGVNTEYMESFNTKELRAEYTEDDTPDELYAEDAADDLEEDLPAEDVMAEEETFEEEIPSEEA